MKSSTEWLTARGPTLAAVIESRRHVICERVTSQMIQTFPKLCYFPERTDAVKFQRQTFTETPRRFHRVMQVVFNFQALQVIEREYTWGWNLLSRYGVTRQHLKSQVSWYFDALHESVLLNERDLSYLRVLGREILQTIDRVTMISPVVLHHARAYLSTNGSSLS